jgi:mycoredoxin
MSAFIAVYGTDWCGETQRTRHHLDQLGIPYQYVNLDEDESAERKVIEWNGGKRLTPTVVISSPAGTNRLCEPEDLGIDCVLARHEMPEAA